jgi:antitoxin component YwqK of YwqJK toxin-antitoxin module
MRIFLILLIFLPVFSFAQINQTDANGLRQGLWEKKQPNGRLLYTGHFKDGKPVGEWKRFHGGGQVKAIINYKSSSDTAFTKLFDKYGKKIAEGNFLNQKKVGNWVYFSKGRKISEEQFAGGLKNGISKQYYETGELMEEVEWKNGKQDGNFQIFYKNGKPYLQCKMQNNKRNGRCLIYYKNERLQLEAGYKNGLRHGEWKFFDGKGNFQYQLNYNEGELLNPEVRDSTAALKMQNFEKNRGRFTDPEKFMQDPSEYMRKMKIY